MARYLVCHFCFRIFFLSIHNFMRNYFAVLLTFMCSMMSSQVQFQKLYGDTISEDGFSVCRSKHEVSYVYTGRSQTPTNTNLILTKVDALGDTVWTKILTNTGFSQGRCVIATADSGYAVVGTKDNAGAQDALIIKLDKLGQVQWSHIFDLAGNFESGRSLIQCPDGSYFLLGNTSGATVSSPFLLHLGKMGNLKWSKVYTSAYDRLGEALTLTSDGAIAVTGSTKDSLTSAMNPLVFKADTASGNFIWARMSIGNNGSVFYSILQNGSNELVLAGGTQDHNVSGLRSAIFSKFSLSGTMSSFQSYNDCHTMLSYKILQRSGGGYAMAGFIMPCTASSLNAFLLQLNSNGSIASHAIYGNTLSVMTGWDLLQEGNSGFVIAGSQDNTSASPVTSDALVFRTDAAGSTGCNTYTVNLQSANFTPTFFPTSFINGSGLNGSVFIPTFNKGLKISTLCYTAVTTSADEFIMTKEEPTLYPNPFDNKVTIALSPDHIESIRVFDIQGKEIKGVAIEGNGTYTHLSLNSEGKFQSGIYLFRIKLNSGEVFNIKAVHNSE